MRLVLRQHPLPFFAFLLTLATPLPQTRAAEGQSLHGQVPAAVPRLAPLGPLPAGTRLDLAIGLPLRNQEALTKLLRELYNPASPQYRHFLTPEQFAQRFGPHPADYQKVVAFAKANGLQITGEHPNRLLLDVRGTVADIERALHLKLHTYRHPTEPRTFYAPDTEPSLDLTVPVLGISGLNNYALPRPRLQSSVLTGTEAVTPNAGSGPSGTYMGHDFRAAYVPDSSRTGAGQVVGLLQFDGYSASDIAYYETRAGLPSVPLSNVLLDGFNGNPSGFGGEVEVCLDIEMAISMAPGLSQVIVYMAGPYGNWHDILNRMATDNLAKQLSCSWYQPGAGADPVADQIFQQMAAQGQSFFNASGDYDAYTGLISFPGDTPYMTQVGGTTLTTTGAGGSWVSETVWNWGDGIGSGGGISTQYPIPSWQVGAGTGTNQGSSTQRNIPDVALIADQVYVRADGFDHNVGGTSCAAPLWAGFMALVNEQAVAAGKPTLGFINPALYGIGNSGIYGAAFRDITTGNNTSASSPSRFFATPGYDLCTGWGTPAGKALINALATPDPLQIVPVSGFAAYGPVGGPFSISSQVYTLTNVGSAPLNWSLVNTSLWLSASASSGSLSPGGPATLVTMSLSGVANALAAGQYNTTLWFTNLSDGVGQSLQFSLAVLTPPAITNPPVDQAVLGGASALFSVGAAGSAPLSYRWQHNGTNLSDGKNISGSVTPSLTIASVSFPDLGFYSVAVSNAVGSTSSAPAQLTMIPSAPVMVSLPADQSVYFGRTAKFSVAVQGTPPFGYQWSFDGTNLSGATGTSLTLTNVQYAQAGSYSVLVTNQFGPTNSPSALLTVNPPPPCLAPPGGLVSWWPGEGSPNDVVGPNQGAAFGNVTYTGGEVGQAFAFDGGSYVAVSNNPSLNPSGSFTVEAWVYPPQNVTAQQVFFGKWGDTLELGNQRSYAVDLEPGNAIRFSISDAAHQGDASFHSFDTPTNAVTVAAWNHVVAVYDQSTGTRRVYVNGAEAAERTDAPITVLNGSAPVTLGAWLRGGGEVASYFTGLLDEPSFYGRALSVADIQALYNAGSAGKCTTPVPPFITAQPASQTVVAGGTATFAVTAGGTVPLSYQWSLNGGALLGQTGTSLSLTNVGPTDAGSYSVLVTNLYGVMPSSNAVLTVTSAPPMLLTQPVSQTAVVGSTITFSATASGTPPPVYQWRFNGGPLAGQSRTSLSLTNVQTTNAGSYSVLVTNLAGSVLSSNAVLTVTSTPPVLIAQPVSQKVLAGSTVKFTATASGTTPLSYQWQFKGGALPGQTGTSLSLTNVQSTNHGSYSVLVTNIAGSVLSSNAVLTVVSSPGCVAPPSGLLSWWQAEGNANDTTGTNQGTPFGAVTYAQGEVGQSFSFNGSSYVQVANSPSLNPTGSFTIETWVYPAQSVTAQQLLFGKWGDSGTLVNQRSYGVSLQPGNAVRFSIADVAHQTDASFHTFDTPQNAITARAWNHIVAVYDQSTGTRRTYVNGVKVAERTDAPITVLNGAASLTLGAWNRGGGLIASYFTGLLDEASFYNSALSAAQIQALYLAGSSGKCVNQSPTAVNLVAATPENVALSLSTNTLLFMASDPDNDPVTVSAVSPVSTNGGPVVLGGGSVLYTPATNFVGVDRFTFTVSDGRGGTASAYVLVNVWSASQPAGNMLAPAQIAGGYQVSFFGLPGYTYTLQRATNITGPWLTLGPVTTDANGLGTFVDTNAPAQGAFYRTTYP